MESEWEGYTEEDYKRLESFLDDSRTVCPPDEYQLRQNILIRAVAHFLLIPYQKRKKNQED